MAYTTIDDPSAYFTTLLYTGNATDDRNLTNSANAGDFQPDLLWLKERGSTSSHQLHDSIRESSKAVMSDNNAAEDVDANRVQAFQSNGFQVGTASTVNQNTITMVAWQWKGTGGTRTAFESEADNANNEYDLHVNQAAGFSINAYVGTGANSTVPHGLGAAPDFVVTKQRSQGSRGWTTWTNALAGTQALDLNETNGVYTSATSWNSTVPSSSAISLGTRVGTNEDGRNFIMYCFKSIQGYSKISSYIGNGSTDGTFVYTGFKPGWLMVKGISANSREWFLFDGKRDPINPFAKYVKAESTDAEASSAFGDFLSNGFKVRSDGASYNASGQTFIYYAIAEHPFVSSEGVPVTAK